MISDKIAVGVMLIIGITLAVVLIVHEIKLNRSRKKDKDE